MDVWVLGIRRYSSVAVWQQCSSAWHGNGQQPSTQRSNNQAIAAAFFFLYQLVSVVTCIVVIVVIVVHIAIVSTDQTSPTIFVMCECIRMHGIVQYYRHVVRSRQWGGEEGLARVVRQWAERQRQLRYIYWNHRSRGEGGWEGAKSKYMYMWIIKWLKQQNEIKSAKKRRKKSNAKEESLF